MKKLRIIIMTISILMMYTIGIQASEELADSVFPKQVQPEITNDVMDNLETIDFAADSYDDVFFDSESNDPPVNLISETVNDEKYSDQAEGEIIDSLEDNEQVIEETELETFGDEGFFILEERDIPEENAEEESLLYAASDAGSGNVVDSGYCGINLTWILYDTGLLYIKGNGDWNVFDENTLPVYHTYKEIVTSVQLEAEISRIGDYAFSGMDHITSVFISSSDIEIGNYAFQGCNALQDFPFDIGVTEIGDHAFSNCLNLKEADLPDGLKTIGDYAFYRCESLEFVYIPISVESIGASSFTDCQMELLRIYAGFDNLDSFGSNWHFFIPATASMTREDAHYWRDLPADTEVLKIPDNIDTLPAWAFSKLTSLRWLYIPKTVIKGPTYKVEYKVVGGRVAYFNAAELFHGVDPYIYSEDLNPPISIVTNLNDFYREYEEEEFDFWSSLDPMIEELVIPEGIRQVPAHLFENSTMLKKVEFPSTLATIRPYAFSGCSLLESITLPQNLTVLGEGAFYQCKKLSELSAFPQYLMTLEKLTFAGTALTEIEIPSSVSTMASDAFTGCESLKKITMARPFVISDTGMETLILTGGTEIPSRAFQGSSLKTVILPDTLKKIGEDAFRSCHQLTNVILPSGLTTIDSGAFAYCSNLGTIYIPDSVTTLGAAVPPRESDYTKAPFYMSQGLLIFVEGEEKSTWNYYWAYNKSGLMSTPVGREKDAAYHPVIFDCSFEEYQFWTSLDQNSRVLEVPDYCEHINRHALYYMNNLEQVIISEGVPKIDDSAFQDKKRLKSISIPDSVTEIGYYFLRGCESLRTIVFSAGIKSISSQMLVEATSLYTIVFSDAVENNSRGSLKDCTSLMSLTIPFVGGSRSEPEALSFLYGGASYTDNKNVIPSTLKEVIITDASVIADRTFFGCASLERITLPKGLKAVPEFCMSGCSNLQEIILPEEVESISAYAFNGCSSMSRIVFTSSDMPTIGEEAFAGVSATLYYPSTWLGELPDIENCRWENYDCVAKHALGEYAVVKEPSCVETGIKRAKCLACGAEVEEEIQKKEHVYGDWDVIMEPSCTEEGIKERICAGCSGKETQAIPAAGHKWDEKYTLDKEATCTEDGREVNLCLVCSEIDEDNVRIIPKKGHDYGDPVWNWAGDFSSATTAFTCRNDENHKETITASVTAEIITEPSYTKAGEKKNIASVDFQEKQYTIEKIIPLDMLVPAGELEQGLAWKVENGVLTINLQDDAQNTEIPDYLSEKYAPWTQAAKELNVSKIIVEEGITKIGSNAFMGLDSVTELDLPRSLVALAGDSMDESVLSTAKITYAGSNSEWDSLTQGTVFNNVEITSTHTHTWDSGKVTNEATSTNEGIMTYTCTDCGETKIEPIAKLPTPAPTITQPTVPSIPAELITIPKKPTNKKPSVSKNKITVNWKHFKQNKKTKPIWKKIRKVQIQCATDSSFMNIVKSTMVGKKKTKATIKGLAKKTTYYVRVRYFDGTGYSAWSGVKKVKTK